MSFDNFDCTRQDIDPLLRVSQRNVLISTYCDSNFSFINLVDFYYRHTDKNAILMFIFICFFFPILFICVAGVADKYLAIGMQDLSERFGLSPTLAAVTLIAFANGAPDLLSSSSAGGKLDGALISLGAATGGLIFASTTVIGGVIANSSKEIVFPKLAITKEFVFLLIAIFWIIVFSFIGTTGYPFLACYMGTYFVYIGFTIFLEKYSPEEEDLEGQLNDNKDDDQIQYQTQDSDVLTVNESRAFEAVISIEESDLTKTQKKDNFINKIIDDIHDKENSPLENTILVPVRALDNPMMKTMLKYFIIASSIVFTVYSLELVEIDFMILCAIGLVFSLICLVLEIVGINKNIMDIVYEIISVFAAIGYISIFSGLVIDFITFLAFYFSLDEVILNSILLSIGNNIGDFFGNIALAKAGEGLMGGFAVYSGQIFNNFIGFSSGIYAGIQVKETGFDVFGLKKQKPLPPKHYFLMAVLIFIPCVLIFSYVTMYLNEFKLNKKLANTLIIIYVIYFCCALTFGVLTRG